VELLTRPRTIIFGQFASLEAVPGHISLRNPDIRCELHALQWRTTNLSPRGAKHLPLDGFLGPAILMIGNAARPGTLSTLSSTGH
jgi:hypothetical protein